MVERNHKKLSVSQQYNLLGLSRGSQYYKPKCDHKPQENTIKQLIEKLWSRMPYCGAKKMSEHLKRMDFDVSEKRVRKYYKELKIRTIYTKPKTTTPNRQHDTYPYLLKNMEITHKNQVWSTDITYIPMNGGWLYLCAIIDWHSRYVLAWDISTTHDSESCLQVLRKAMSKYGVPQIFNTDQGSEFTAKNFTSILEEKGVKISMDGVGRALDNIYIERFWRSVKYEYFYLNRPQTGKELKRGLKQYINDYNDFRLHQSLNYKTPKEVYNMVA